MVLEDVSRMERLLTGVREISRIDSGTADGEGVSAWLPPGRLEQAVENLVDNAAGFSPPGGVVGISVGKDAGWAVLRVSDDGPGILREHRDRIYDRFFSFRPNEKKGAHAGLGLSIVKAIAESHGGSVAVLDPQRGGACFEVRFPIGKT